jgi:Ca2+-binding RTX toxin-like protein
MVTYIRSDIEFILEQVIIAEKHAGGQPLFGPGGLIPSPNLSLGLRTVDGTYNHLLPGTTNQGAADRPFPHLLDPQYRPAGEVLDMNGPAPGGQTAPTYAPSNNPGSVVVDSSLRTISNLIVDQTIGNPVAVQRYVDAGLGIIDDDGVLHHFDDTAPGNLGAVVGSDETLRIPNVAPDVGLSASFNSWFTLFGQFFDHGLDLVSKGGSGTVFIPLKEDDPLYDPTSQTNFMVLTRATVGAGPDNQMGTDDDVHPVNTTTPFVDQNQTYTSHPSHQVFLREYDLVGGRPVATGKLLDGTNGGLPTWGEIKAQARDILGINLTDFHVGNLPLLATDPYGNFIPDPATGFPQVVMLGTPTTLASGTPADPLELVTPEGTHLAVRTGHAFLDDIAHTAAPVGKLSDGDIEIGLGNLDPDQFYDQALLDAHFVTGDGRGNENIGLTAVHHVFHSEHNRLLEHTKDVVLATGDIAFINQWLDTPIASLPTDLSTLDWNGERLFQAAKFGTEMQYQHLVFEEFARKIQPNINVFLVPDGFDVDIDPTIVAEFAHVVYRFGHSMLTETIDRFDPNFNADHIGLIEGFLNPLEFKNGGTAEEGAGAIIRGMTRQVGNEIDEFVTDALRNNLLGLPLDLATINLARGRDTGVPSLNAARRDFYEKTNNAIELKPYDNWVDFAGNLKNEASVVNFIAAYGLHPLITAETSVEGKRAAALSIIFGSDQAVEGDPSTDSDDRTIAAPTDAEDFLNSTGDWANGAGGVTTTGLDNVDLWIGGLAEKITPFGGMLGSTFNFVFETQLEKLQNGDRFYYLQRLDGLHLFGEMEANSFAAMIERNTDARHLPSDVFSAPGLLLEVDRSRQYNEGLGDADPVGGTTLTPWVIRNNPATAGPDTNYLRYTGAEHVVLGGTDGSDILSSSEGDDTLYGDGGNDRVEGGFGNDIINAGTGDDIVTDAGGDDNIKAGDGNDVVNAGPGLDLVLGGRGQDFIILGTDMGSEVFGGEGNDFILGNKNAERILGNEGDDWLETGTFDGAPGDNFDEIFAKDGVQGHDVFHGDGGFDEFIGEGGDDVMVGSPGRGKMIGMSGWDWVTYKNNGYGIDADLTRPVVFDENPTPPENAALDAYEAIEGLSGSKFADKLTGSEEDATTLPFQGFRGSELDAAGIARIAGLQGLLGAGVSAFAAGDIILGGDGDDLITGLGGDDVIDGDKWLNVRISVRANSDGTGAEIATANSMTELTTRMFNGTFNPGQLVVVREILTADGTGDIDTAMFRGAASEYDITANLDGSFTIAHIRGTQVDGTDRLRNVERAQFADGTMALTVNTAASGAPLIGDQTPTEGTTLTASVGSIEDANGFNPASVTFQWQALVAGVWTNVATGASFTPGQARVNQPLRVVANFTDNAGHAETRTSLETDVVGDLYVGNSSNNVFNGNAGADDASGGGGADTLNGNAGDDILRGQGANDTLNGGAGNDTLEGGTGADRLNGGPGTDTMRGGADNDVYIVDQDTDIVIELAGEGIDRIETALTLYALGDNVENLSFTGTGAFVGTGNDLANTIRGRSGADILDGGGGIDTLIGSTGNDTYRVNDASETVTEFAGEGNDTIEFTSTSFTARANVENLTFIGTGNATLTGNTLSNRLTGGGGDDSINGLAGSDTLDGGAGVDSLSGGDGNDRLTGGTGGDAMNGGLGNDIFVFLTGSGADVIAGFDGNPTNGQDRLDVQGMGVTAANFGAAVTIAQSGADTLITIGTDTITLVSVNASTITQADFII